MIIYEFWLSPTFREQAFEVLCDGFYNLGRMMGRWDNPEDEVGNPIDAPCVYAVSRNPNTHWVQLLVDDNTPSGFITAIEARINGLKDDHPMREYTSPQNNVAPMERPK